MSKNIINYECPKCGTKAKSKRYYCPQCQSPDPYIPSETEDLVSKAGFKGAKSVSPTRKASKLSELSNKEVKRFKTGINELDRVLGGGFVESEVVLFAAQPGTGKALAGSTIIPTPSGLKKIKDIHIGDEIFDGNGNITKVVAKFNPTIDHSYVITFSNGEKVVACGDHLWDITDTKNNKKIVINTTELHKENDTKRWKIKLSPTQNSKKTDFKKTPYEIANLINNNIIKEIPEEYFNTTIEQRQELLQGFMDTNHTIVQNNEIQAFFNNTKTAKNVKRLLASLGIPSTTVNNTIIFTTNFNCFKNPEYKRKFSISQDNNIFIETIEETVCNEEFYCLMVESELHTFMCTEYYIPTHNSTLSLSISERFAKAGKTVLYSSGEESEHQIALRAKRMGVDNDNIHVINETDLSKILGYIEEIKPDFVVVDSLQTVASSEIPGGIGSVQQSKEAAHTLTNLAKNKNIIMLLINQMTKE